MAERTNPGHKPGFIFAVLVFGLALIGSRDASGQVGLDAHEIHRLQALIRTDAQVKNLYDSVQAIADAAVLEQPNPIDTLRTEGLLQGDPRKTATWEAIRDMHKIYALAVSWRVTRQRQYLDKTSVYLIAWADSNASRGDPIDDTNLDPAIEGYAMVRDDLVSGETKRIDSWLRRTAQAEIDAPFNKPERRTAVNNWNSHRLKIIGEIGFTIGDKPFQTYAIEGIKKQIANNLSPEGSSDDFAERDALHYHVYDLEPLLKLAIVLKKATGVDYYSYISPSGSSIRHSVEWLIPYVDGTKTHPEFVHSTVEFDRKRAANGEAGYKSGSLFDPKNGIPTLLLAAWFDRAMMAPVQRLLGTDTPYPNWTAVLDELSRK